MNDFINTNSYSRMADYEYQSHLTNIPSGLVHCDIGLIPEFFRRITNSKNRYVVLSSSSDFGVFYQKDFPVWADMAKAVSMFVDENLRYQDLNMKSRHDSRKCNIYDDYIIKCYAWTPATFSVIPDNVVHWFTTNCGIAHPRVSSIPFGVLNGPLLEETMSQVSADRTKGIYVNFAFYTNERAKLFAYLAHAAETNPNITVERDVDYPTFIKRLKEHKFCLSPIGNGIDCYRTWESLYCGCVPIVQAYPGTQFLTDLSVPIVMLRYLEDVAFASNDNTSAPFDIDITTVTLTYWRNKIYEKVNQL